MTNKRSAAMKTLILVVSALALGTFENCARTSFGGNSEASQSAADGGDNANSIPTTTSSPATTICSFGTSSGGSCDLDHAFVGNLYIEPRALISSTGTSYANGPYVGETDVNTYLANPNWIAKTTVNGVSQAYVVALSSLDSLNNSFASGFSAEDGSNVQVPDASGNYGSVPNYFALDLKANFHLGASDQPGAYQIAIIADDGAQIYVTDANGQNPTLLVDDQVPAAMTNAEFIPGSQYARMGCSPTIGDATKIQTLNMTASTVIPLEVRYTNGPSGLSLRVMYRPVPASGADDQYCETDANGDPSTKPAVSRPLQLDVSQLSGWKVINSDNL